MNHESKGLGLLGLPLCMVYVLPCLPALLHCGLGFSHDPLPPLNKGTITQATSFDVWAPSRVSAVHGSWPSSELSDPFACHCGQNSRHGAIPRMIYFFKAEAWQMYFTLSWFALYL